MDYQDKIELIKDYAADNLDFRLSWINDCQKCLDENRGLSEEQKKSIDNVLTKFRIYVEKEDS